MADRAPRTLHHGSDYREHRAAAYAPITDQIDLIIKALAAMADSGVQLPPEATDLIEMSRAVKARFPKPQA